MSIDKTIEKTYKDMSGSIAKNRLTIQISYAIQLIIDLYSVQDYTVFLDCLEDVAVKVNNENSEKIYLYQIKTKNKSNISLNHVISEKWLEQLYAVSKNFKDFDYESALVVNTDISEKGQAIFANSKSNFEKNLIEKPDVQDDKKIINRIKQCISESEGISISEVDLSKFFFIKTDLHTTFHKNQALLLFNEFIGRIDSHAELAKVKAFFRVLYDTLDTRFNNEINPKNTDYKEIASKKGYTKEEFISSVKSYMQESIPKNTELFNLLNVRSVGEQKEFSLFRPKFLMDLTNNDEPFKIFIEEINLFVKNSKDVDLLNNCVEYISSKSNISSIYKEAGYIKFATAYVYYNYINGGEISE